MFSHVELETQIRLVFSLLSHAPRVTVRQCQIPKANHNLASDTIDPNLLRHNLVGETVNHRSNSL